MSNVWFVTGSSRGLGRAIVEVALEAGHRVAATARSPERLNDLRDKYGDAVLLLRLDVTDYHAAARVVAQVSSLSVRVSAPGLSAYQAAKWAVAGFSSGLAHESRCLEEPRQ